MSQGNAIRMAATGAAALGATLLLFLFPLFMSGIQGKPPLPAEYGAVCLSSVHSADRSSEKDSPKAEEQAEPEQIRDFAPPTPVMQFSPQTPQASLDLPDMPFTINPKMVTGMNLPAPASISGMAAPAAMSAGGALSLGELDNTPARLFAPQPPYPHEAKRRNIETSILAELLVDPKGNVLSVRIVKGKHRKLFEATVRKTLLRWRFKPGTQNGRPVQWRALVSVNFNQR